MAFRDPLRNYSTIDGINYLDPKIENFLELDAPESFKNSINVLLPIRNALRVAKTIGRIGEIPTTEYYMQTIQWLNKQMALGAWIGVPQLTSYNDITEDVASNFSGHAANVLSNLVNQSLFQQIQLMQGVLENTIVQGIIDDIEAPIEENFKQTLRDEQSAVTVSLDATQEEKARQLTALFNEQMQQVRTAGSDATSSFEQARALASWSEFYAGRVHQYELALYGKVWPVNATARKLSTYRKYRKSLSMKERARTILATIIAALRCLRQGWAIVYSKISSYSGRRFLWFVLIALSIILIMAVNLLSIYGTKTFLGINVAPLKATHKDTLLFAKAATYLAVLFIPTIGYSFANKNYRIYSNLLEQYRHREIVAKTIQGILARPRGDDDDEAVRKELANVASVALFEQKTVGHLSKQEANSASIIDILRTFRS